MPMPNGKCIPLRYIDYDHPERYSTVICDLMDFQWMRSKVNDALMYTNCWMFFFCCISLLLNQMKTSQYINERVKSFGCSWWDDSYIESSFLTLRSRLMIPPIWPIQNCLISLSFWYDWANMSDLLQYDWLFCGVWLMRQPFSIYAHLVQRNLSAISYGSRLGFDVQLIRLALIYPDCTSVTV